MKKLTALAVATLLLCACLFGCARVQTGAKEEFSPMVSDTDQAEEAEAGSDEEQTSEPDVSAALEMNVPIESDMGTITITEVDPTPMFAPAEMADDEKAISVKAILTGSYTDSDAMSALYDACYLTDGTDRWTPGAGAVLTVDDGTQYTYIFAVPEEIDIAALVFVIAGEARKIA